MTRLPDADQRLEVYIESRRQAAFSFGDNDCASFVRGAVEAQTGEDPCPGLTWSTEAEAEALLPDLERIVTEALGEPVPVRCVRRGGVLLLTHGRGVAIKVGARACAPGVFTDHQVTGETRGVFGELDFVQREVAAVQRSRLVFLPLSRFSKGWNIP